LTPEEKAIVDGEPAKAGPVVLRQEMKAGNAPFCLGTKPNFCPVQLDLKPKFWFPKTFSSIYQKRGYIKQNGGTPKENKKIWDEWRPSPACGMQKTCEHKALVKKTSLKSFKDKQGKYAGLSAKVLIASDATHSDCDMYGNKCQTTNCQCQSYIQVSGYREFIASELTLTESSPFDLCAAHGRYGSRQVKHGKPMPFPKYLRVNLQTRLGEDYPWTEHESFFLTPPKLVGPRRPKAGKETSAKYVLPLKHIRARDVRIMLACTRTATIDAYPIELYTDYKNARWRTFKVEIKAETTDFNWNSEVINATTRAIDPISGEIDCDKVNNDTVIAKHFAGWATPGDGSFVQEPPLSSNTTVRVFTSSDSQRYLDAFASKKRATVLGYRVEKKLICVQNNTVAPICCAQKNANSDRQYNWTHSDNILSAVVRNF